MSEVQEQEQEAALLALLEACSDYARLDDEMTTLSSQREQQRVHISELVALILQPQMMQRSRIGVGANRIRPVA